jgi:hypothetical protein
MSLAQQLHEAVGAKRLDEAAERVVLTPGQMVSVRTKRGVNVIKKGRVTEVDKATGIIRVVDISSGTTLETDVDPSRYVVWILPPPSATVDRMTRIRSLYVRGGGLRPSAYQGGKWP